MLIFTISHQDPSAEKGKLNDDIIHLESALQGGQEAVSMNVKNLPPSLFGGSDQHERFLAPLLSQELLIFIFYNDNKE